MQAPAMQAGAFSLHAFANAPKRLLRAVESPYSR